MNESEMFMPKPVPTAETIKTQAVETEETPAAETTQTIEKNTPENSEGGSDSLLDLKSTNTFDNIHDDPSRGASTSDGLIMDKEPTNKTENPEMKSYNKNETNETNDMKNKWDKVENEIEKSADSLGLEIDEGIKDPVIALNAFEINTAQSCEGHLDNGKSAPWIRIEAPKEPEERFINQNETFKKVAEKYNITFEEVKKADNDDAYWEAMKISAANGETKDYQKWREESGKLLYITRDILDDFYKNRQVPSDIKIKVDTENMEDMAEGSFEIFNGGKDFRDINEINLSEEEKKSLGNRLNEYRKEMDVFANFLKEKFFSEGENYMNDKRNKAQEKMDQEKMEKIIGKIFNKEARNEVPEKLYRGFTVNPTELSMEKLKETLLPLNVNEKDPTKIHDGNELGVYMSTNQHMVEKAYAVGGNLGVKCPQYNDGYGLVDVIRLPSCGIVLEVDTKNLQIRKPEITHTLQGVYNNGFQGDEWIADKIPAERYKLKKLILSRFANDSERFETDVVDDKVDEAINIIKTEFQKRKETALKYKEFLESVPEKTRFSGFNLKRKWQEFNEEKVK